MCFECNIHSQNKKRKSLEYHLLVACVVSRSEDSCPEVVQPYVMSGDSLEAAARRRIVVGTAATLGEPRPDIGHMRRPVSAETAV